ncbi:MAG: 23S rRNA (adenine(2030)-N(6))-methyltransferase RlmJ, partial [Brachybacterium sp.]|nr:23S rRNA (adenine(2030)-N(6))-methyltransferase RlmJ [Brachybacterium sp.]
MPRIVAGQLGGRTIPGPPGKGTRPTSDKVREALFNRLEGWDALAGARVLDLYAGTGALAFEALSRGAEHALLAELHGPTAKQLRRTASELGLDGRVEIRAGKAASVAGQLATQHAAQTTAPAATLVFLDPPYDVPTEALEQMLLTLRTALDDDALDVIERSSRTRLLEWPEGWA